MTTPDKAWVPVTFTKCDHILGPFFHGTNRIFVPGDRLVPGHESNFQQGRVSNNVYFSALLDTAAWGAELSSALSGSTGRGRIYRVEPSGPFEDDPNVTNKRFPGNVTQSYRTRDALVVVSEVTDWAGHDPEVLQMMLDNLARRREEGTDLIED